MKDCLSFRFCKDNFLWKNEKGIFYWVLKRIQFIEAFFLERKIIFLSFLIIRQLTFSSDDVLNYS